MATKVRWQDVRLWEEGMLNGESVDGHHRGDDNRERIVSKLREYRETGCIYGVFLDDPETYTEDDGDAICDAGPRPEGIDWAGFPESL